MDKLQYDSFYKFVVSGSLVIIVAPLIIMHFWISGSYDLMITQEALDSLTVEAAELMMYKLRITKAIYDMLPVMFCICELVGVILLIWGCYKWYSIQTVLDRIPKLDVEEKDRRLKQMDESEVVEKIVEEKKEENGSENNTEEVIINGLKIEELYFKRLKSSIGNDYRLRRNVRIKDIAYDIIARSLKDNVDIIYDIKYWERIPSETSLNSIFKHLSIASYEYERNMHRNKRIVLVIVSDKNTLSKLKEVISVEDIKLEHGVEVELVDKTTL